LGILKEAVQDYSLALSLVDVKNDVGMAEELKKDLEALKAQLNEQEQKEKAAAAAAAAREAPSSSTSSTFSSPTNDNKQQQQQQPALLSPPPPVHSVPTPAPPSAVAVPSPSSKREHEMEAVPGLKTTRCILKASEKKPVVAKAVGVGSKVKVHAKGVLKESGKCFWDTQEKGGGQHPFEYTAGMGRVITGWDQGCLGMKEGEQRLLEIPAPEGYGASGFPAWSIPPHASLLFTLECLSVE
jgi:FKBP-type peptidyl-prolyl cis-trans isomerase